MTLLATSFFADTVEWVRRHAEQAWGGGAEAVEVRIDEFRDAPGELAEYLRRQPDKTWIIACRAAEEGGRSHGGAADRLAFLLNATQGADAYLDFEWSAWRSRPNLGPRQAVQERRLILSIHDFQALPPDPAKLVDEIHSREPCAVAKIAYRPSDIGESFAALDLMRNYGRRVIAVCVGEEGAWTRLLAKKLEAFATYCALDDAPPTAPGQWTLRQMIEQFRWSDIDAETKVFGVIGDPVAQSMSPLLFNHWFGQQRIHAVYMPLRVAAENDSLARFLDACRQRLWLDVGGFSITHPHKTAAFAWLGREADRAAENIGAVNTLVYRNGGVRGYNTDCHAVIDSLLAALGCSRPDLRGLPVDVLGTGGAARAAVSGLRDFGANVVLYGRSKTAANQLQNDLGCSAYPWDQRVRRQGRVLVNCTTVGMAPKGDASPMPAESLIGCELVFDLVYNPLQTRLLRDAADRDVRTLNGLDMFIRQAAVQFQLWTGQSPDASSARHLLQTELSCLGAMSGKETIALIGLRGSGKTTVGRVLAKLLQGSHIDSDELVEQQSGRTIAEIFVGEGEAGFRQREIDAIASAVAQAPAVISVGGGAVLDLRNVDLLREAATLVWLTGPLELLAERISRDDSTLARRPPLSSLSLQEELGTLQTERAKTYGLIANHVVNTAGKTPEAIAHEIAALLGRRPSGKSDFT